MTSRTRKKREFSSGLQLSAKAMVKKVKDLIKDWSYDVISLGYPGPVIRNRPIAEPRNLGHGWAGFDFARAFRRPARGCQRCVDAGARQLQGRANALSG